MSVESLAKTHCYCWAAVYALRRPDPAPAAFGCHEVFHCWSWPGAAHFLAISLFALRPG